MRNRTLENTIEKQVERCENFAEFMNMPYYKVFKANLQDKAMKLGLDAKSSEDVLQANGARKLALELLDDLDVQERLVGKIL
jgi:uncharacterized HAD superfamily protein